MSVHIGSDERRDATAESATGSKPAADTCHVRPVTCRPGRDAGRRTVTAYLAENAEVWDRIVAKYGLRSANLPDLVGYGDQHADFAFAYGAPAGPRAFVSTVKLRQAGFTKTIDTEDAFRNALQSLIDRKLLPPTEQ
jgi:hypothetical protein